MYLTNLYYKVDLEHCIAVVNEQGRVVGYLKAAVHVVHGKLCLATWLYKVIALSYVRLVVLYLYTAITCVIYI